MKKSRFSVEFLRDITSVKVSPVPKRIQAIYDEVATGFKYVDKTDGGRYKNTILTYDIDGFELMNGGDCLDFANYIYHKYKKAHPKCFLIGIQCGPQKFIGHTITVFENKYVMEFVIPDLKGCNAYKNEDEIIDKYLITLYGSPSLHQDDVVTREIAYKFIPDNHVSSNSTETNRIRSRGNCVFEYTIKTTLSALIKAVEEDIDDLNYAFNKLAESAFKKYGKDVLIADDWDKPDYAEKEIKLRVKRLKENIADLNSWIIRRRPPGFADLIESRTNLYSLNRKIEIAIKSFSTVKFENRSKIAKDEYQKMLSLMFDFNEAVDIYNLAQKKDGTKLLRIILPNI
ncbi:hypothetical protein LQZ19_15965 [Treponema primitia]|uniref:hypothetical protein n=1 Tax=Treponema primitia TaxID=88058 RepID=UPI00397F1E07